MDIKTLIESNFVSRKILVYVNYVRYVNEVNIIVTCTIQIALLISLICYYIVNNNYQYGVNKLISVFIYLTHLFLRHFTILLFNQRKMKFIFK